MSGNVSGDKSTLSDLILKTDGDMKMQLCVYSVCD